MKAKPGWYLLAISVGAIALSAAAAADDAVTNDAKMWDEAEAKFKEYCKSIDPDLHYAIVRSERLEKLLPGFRVYVPIADVHLIGKSDLFLVDRQGKVSDLGEAVWTGDNPSKSFQVKKIAAFLKLRRIKVANADDAIEVAKLFEELVQAPGYVSFLRDNTNHFTVFDKRFIERSYGPRSDYQYSATPRDGGWRVKVDYVGPPAMIQAPPKYEIDLDERQRFSDLRQYTEFPYS